MALEQYGETFDDIVSITLSDEQLDVLFDSELGGNEGEPFTAWTHTRVYFPCCYDWSEWVGSVSRNPDGNPTCHIGG
jgi:hypothetical protein